MANDNWHLSLSAEDRLKLLELLLDDEFRTSMEDNPVDTLADNGICLTEQDLKDIVKANLKLPSVDDLRANMDDLVADVPITGLHFRRIFPIFCRGPVN